ncbi:MULTISPECIES: hypothetical protein [unclassified Moorena]|uniref:hypothetical protein n=1 Tax=unclassified Moorena TaxID=2683338 RepID=UPI0013B8D2AF|nr:MULTISPECIES: hypothetical protein [unclassified Moorena]NEP65771.1 hypothetical protein [Moorena sp. SIO3A5]NER92019.1 hypothetical protein [Moorena sp. SIO3A2]NES87197.1 hypothetical protein [Moorena sp. SIO2B7]
MRYGAGCPNTEYEVEHQGKPAPNAPYWTWYASTELIIVVPDSRLPIPDSRFPTPYSLLPFLHDLC